MIIVDSAPDPTPKDKKAILEQIINLLKEHPQVQELFERYNVPIAAIDKIPIKFKKLDVSAKAKNGEVYINEDFLQDGNILDDIHYVVHELTHILQQITGNCSEGDYPQYLDDPSEIEAFREQIKFIDGYKNPEEADKYVDDLLDFHDFKGKEREQKRKELRG